MHMNASEVHVFNLIFCLVSTSKKTILYDFEANYHNYFIFQLVAIAYDAILPFAS
jgi:hypothetical protein